MKRFLVFAIIILWILFLVFALIFFFKEKSVSPEMPQNIPETSGQEEQEDQTLPVSMIVAPTRGTTLRQGFEVKVQEADAGGSGLAVNECRYSVYDCGSDSCTPTVFNAKRSCNDSFLVFIGEGQSCFSQGKAICRVAVYSKDYAGNSNSLSENQGSISTFGIDFVPPQVLLEQTSLERSTLTVSLEGRVSDNVEVSNCQIMANGEGISDAAPLVFSSIPCQQQEMNVCYAISGVHTFSSPAVREFSFFCWDLAGNARRSETYTIEVVKNRAPQISSCRVLPTSGNTSSTFVFQTEAVDVDQDSLSYQWDVGDGTLLSGREASYEYNKPGVYRPELTVQDSFQAQVRCSTAWVVVE